MKAIWKFPINPRTTVEMPEGARLLSIQVQDHQPMLWALVDPYQPKVSRTFRAIATGQEFDDDGLTYVGTFLLDGGALVYHAFEETAE